MRAYFRALIVNDVEAFARFRDPGWTPDYPQSGERIPCYANERAIADHYPGAMPEIDPGRIVGTEDKRVVTPSFTVERIAGAATRGGARGLPATPMDRPRIPSRSTRCAGADLSRDHLFGPVARSARLAGGVGRADRILTRRRRRPGKLPTRRGRTPPSPASFRCGHARSRPERRPVARGSPRLTSPSSWDDHARRVRGARDLDRHADRRARARRPRAVRLGLLQRSSSVRSSASSSSAAPSTVAGSRPVCGGSPALFFFSRSACLVAGWRPRWWSSSPPGSSRGSVPDDPADRLCGHRADPPRNAATADVRDALDRMGPARRHRPGDRRDGRRGDQLAVRLPRPPPAHRRGRGADARRAAGRRGCGGAHRDRRPGGRPARAPSAGHPGRASVPGC